MRRKRTTSPSVTDVRKYWYNLNGDSLSALSPIHCQMLISTHPSFRWLLQPGSLH